MTGAVSSTPVLECRDIQVVFPAPDGSRMVAVENVSLSVAAGQLCCLVGPSGCGKSTLLHVIAGLTRPVTGSTMLDGRLTQNPNPQVAYMTQRDTLLPWATALDNAMLPIRAMRRKDRELARDLLDRVGLRGFEGHLPHQLSGGMRKRVQLARALAQNPRLLLMDEPFGALDSQTKILIQRQFLHIWERDRISVVLVTHDLAEAIAMADKIYLMSRRPGRLKATYDVDLPRPRHADGVFTEPTYQEVYRRIWKHLEEELVDMAAGSQ